MAGALLVTHENVLDIVLLEQLVINGKNCAARIAEKVLDTIVAQCPHHNLGAGHFVALVRFLGHGQFRLLLRHIGC